MSSTTSYDVAVIGSGFGGLGTALSLAERGYKVAIFETLKYPGVHISAVVVSSADQSEHV